MTIEKTSGAYIYEEFGIIGVSTGLIGVLQVNEIIKIILQKGRTLDGQIMIFNLLNMSIKKLNLSADKLNKKINNLSEFKDYYQENKCMSKNSPVKKINAEEFYNLYQSSLKKILLIDVREEKEFSKSSINGSISIPLSRIEDKSFIEFIRKESIEKEIYTLCQLGKRSEKASGILMKFKIDSISIEGGIKKIYEFQTYQ